MSRTATRRISSCRKASPSRRPRPRLKKDREHLDAEELAKRLGAITLVFKLKAGEQGKTFGSVTNKDISEALKREHKIEVERTKIHLSEPLKTLGAHSVDIRLMPDVHAKVMVAVEPA